MNGQSHSGRVLRLDHGNQVSRYDVTRLDSRPVVTPQGFLRIEARLTRSGVLPYALGDGTVRRELRHPDEVFHADSLNTLAYAPLTDLHPAQGIVNPSNVKQLQIGIVSEASRRDGIYAAGAVLVQHADTIRDVQSGKRCELSPGYTCMLEVSQGEYKGERYDCIQRMIRYNHVAIGPKGWGRAGAEVSLRMDSATGGVLRVDAGDFGAMLRAQLLDVTTLNLVELAASLGMHAERLDSMADGFTLPTEDEMSALASQMKMPPSELIALVPASQREIYKRFDGMASSQGVTVMKITIRFDGIEYPVEIPDALAPTFQSQFSALQTKADGNASKVLELTSKLDAADKQVLTLTRDLTTARDPKAIDAAIAQLTELRTDAALVLGDDFDFKAKSPKEIKLATLKVTDPALHLDSKGDEYVDGMYDAAIARVKSGDVSAHLDSGAAAARGALPSAKPKAGMRNDGADAHDSEAARLRMIERNAKAWQPKPEAQES